MSTYDEAINRAMQSGVGPEIEVPITLSKEGHEKVFRIQCSRGVAAKRFDYHEMKWSHLKSLLMTLRSISTESQVEIDGLSSENQRKAKDGGVWIPGELIDRDGSRVRDNIFEVDALVLDIDCGMSIDDVRKPICDFEYVIHSTFSHTESKPKWRVVLPLKSPISPDLLPKAFDAVNDWYGGQLDVSCGHDPARLYYLPRCPMGSEHLFVSVHNEGQFLDWSALLSSTTTSSTLVRTLQNGSGGQRPEVSQPRPAVEGKRHDTLIRYAGKLIKARLSTDEVLDRCIRWNETNSPPLPSDEVISTVDDLTKRDRIQTDSMQRRWDEVVLQFNATHVWITNVARAWNIELGKFFTRDQIISNTMNQRIQIVVDGKTRVAPLAQAWLLSPLRQDFKDIVFNPGDPERINGCLNLWKGWPYSPTPEDVSPWNAILDYVFSGDAAARKWFEQWVAYPFRYPGTKLKSAVVLWSAVQGVGKSLLGNTIGMLYGDYFNVITATELHSDFNEWAGDVQFVLGEENSGADKRADSNRLKHLITGETVTFNEKYQAKIVLKNRMNFLFTSNSPQAFHIETYDRRFFVWEIDGKRLPSVFFDDFVKWRDASGLPALLHHLMNVDLSDFNPNGDAPMTIAKQSMIDNSRTELERWIHSLTEDGAAVLVLGKEVISTRHLARTYGHLYSRSVSETAVGRTLASMGLSVRKRVSVPGEGRTWLTAMTRAEVWAGRESSEWVAEYEKKPLIPRSRL